MVPLRGDPYLYMKAGNTCTNGLVGAYLDDNLLAGNSEFDALIDYTSNALESKPVERDNIEVVGIHIRTETIYRRNSYIL